MVDGGRISEDTSSAHRATKLCRYCANVLNQTAIYCKDCEKFQDWKTRLFAGIEAKDLITLIPIVTLAVAFLQEKALFPHSEVKATVARCTKRDIVFALSNTGSRTGIIEGGTVERVIPNQDTVTRALRPSGTGEPINIAASASAVQRFEMVEARAPESVLLMPDRPSGTTCSYRISLSIIDFDGSRTKRELSPCDCPA